MDALVRVPHGFLRRNLSRVERGLVAAGLALVVYRLFTSFPVYPSPWEVVAATAIFFVVLWSPPLGYFLAVTSALYPLYSVSLYLAVLFLAVALLGQRVFINNMGATLLVLLVPWLAQFHLEWVVVLMGGLWWSKAGGAWMGGLAALWGILLFGMSGQSPNWLDNMGIAPSSAGLVAQFKDANSLETLKLIVAPLGPNPTQALYHLLQIVVWAVVGGEVGVLSETSWVQQQHPWRAIGVVIFGATAMALLTMGMAYWLEQYKTADFAWIFPGVMESALYAAVVVSLLEGLRDVVEHPLLLRRPRQAADQGETVRPAPVPLLRRLGARLGELRRLRPARQTIAQVNSAEVGQAAMPGDSVQAIAAHQPAPKDQPHREAKKQPPDDIIKIELD